MDHQRQKGFLLDHSLGGAIVGGIVGVSLLRPMRADHLQKEPDHPLNENAVADLDLDCNKTISFALYFHYFHDFVIFSPFLGLPIFITLFRVNCRIQINLLSWIFSYSRHPWPNAQ